MLALATVITLMPTTHDVDHAMPVGVQRQYAMRYAVKGEHLYV